MRALLQRVTHGSVSVDGSEVGRCGKGFVILLGVGQGDTEAEADMLVKKIAALRVFADEAGKLNLSVKDTGGEILLVSQFTLYADCSHGNRPGFAPAAAPDDAERLYEYFARGLRACDIPVQQGIFGADMQVELTNDGPVTIMLEKEAPGKQI